MTNNLSPILSPRDCAPLPRLALDVPSGLVGRWKVEGYTTHYDIAPNGKYFIVGTGCTWALLDSGNTLDLCGDFYMRVWGSPDTIVGVWRSADGEDLTLREDGSYTSHWADQMDYWGSYEVSGSAIIIRELRAVLSVSGNAMTFEALYLPDQPGTFSIDSTDQWTFIPAVGDPTLYTRVAS